MRRVTQKTKRSKKQSPQPHIHSFTYQFPAYTDLRGSQRSTQQRAICPLGVTTYPAEPPPPRQRHSQRWLVVFDVVEPGWCSWAQAGAQCVGLGPFVWAIHRQCKFPLWRDDRKNILISSQTGLAFWNTQNHCVCLSTLLSYKNIPSYGDLSSTSAH